MGQSTIQVLDPLLLGMNNVSKIEIKCFTPIDGNNCKTLVLTVTLFTCVYISYHFIYSFYIRDINDYNLQCFRVYNNYETSYNKVLIRI